MTDAAVPRLEFPSEEGGDQLRWLLLAGAALGLAFQAKYSVLFFAAALLAGLLATPERRALRSWWFAAGLALAIAISLPNALWQLRFNLPSSSY